MISVNVLLKPTCQNSLVKECTKVNWYTRPEHSVSSVALSMLHMRQNLPAGKHATIIQDSENSRQCHCAELSFLASPSALSSENASTITPWIIPVHPNYLMNYLLRVALLEIPAKMNSQNTCSEKDTPQLTRASAMWHLHKIPLTRAIASELCSTTNRPGDVSVTHQINWLGRVATMSSKPNGNWGKTFACVSPCIAAMSPVTVWHWEHAH